MANQISIGNISLRKKSFATHGDDCKVSFIKITKFESKQ